MVSLENRGSRSACCSCCSSGLLDTTVNGCCWSMGVVVGCVFVEIALIIVWCCKGLLIFTGVCLAILVQFNQTVRCINFFAHADVQPLACDDLCGDAIPTPAFPSALFHQLSRVACSELKTAGSLVEFILAHLAWQKTSPSLGVVESPNASNEFKRGGFLEVRNSQTHCRVGLELHPVMCCPQVDSVTNRH